jgi:hypothetical protein
MGRKHYRARSKVRDLMRYWRRHNMVLWWMTLTSSAGSEAEKLRPHFEAWRKRLARHLGIPYTGVEFVVVDTSEGHGVLHAVVALPPGVGEWLDYSKLREWWDELHAARQCKFKRIGRGDGDVRRLSHYLISQYMVRQGGTVDLLGRISSSRLRVPLGKFRRVLWRVWVDRLRAFEAMGRDLSDWTARWAEVRRQQVACFRVAWDWLLDRGWTVGPDGARWAVLPDHRGGWCLAEV